MRRYENKMGTFLFSDAWISERLPCQELDASLLKSFCEPCVRSYMELVVWRSLLLLGVFTRLLPQADFESIDLPYSLEAIGMMCLRNGRRCKAFLRVVNLLLCRDAQRADRCALMFRASSSRSDNSSWRIAGFASLIT